MDFASTKRTRSVFCTRILRALLPSSGISATTGMISDWMQKRAERNSLRAPHSIYEVHLGSWMRVPEEHNRPLTYREIAPRLAQIRRPDGIHAR